MRFLVDDIAGGPNSYDLNDLVERDIAGIFAAASGLTAGGFGEGVARPEYDFTIGGMPIELKITKGIDVPIEIGKDRDLILAAGLFVTKAAWWIFLMDGKESDIGCGKFRAYSVKALRNAVYGGKMKGLPTYYPGASASQCALVHYMEPFAIPDMWLGNCDKLITPMGKTIGYDLSTWRDAGSNAGDKIRNIVEEYHQDLKDRGLT